MATYRFLFTYHLDLEVWQLESGNHCLQPGGPEPDGLQGVWEMLFSEGVPFDNGPLKIGLDPDVSSNGLLNGSLRWKHSSWLTILLQVQASKWILHLQQEHGFTQLKTLKWQQRTTLAWRVGLLVVISKFKRLLWLILYYRLFRPGTVLFRIHQEGFTVG